MNRRQLLGGVGGMLPPLAGCLGGDSVPSPETESPTPPSACNDNLTRANPNPVDIWKVEEGPLGGFDLDLSKDSLILGGQLTVRLRNITVERRDSGNKMKYDIERQITDGWQSIFWHPKTQGWSDEAIPHAPDEGFTWNLTITQDGLKQKGNLNYYVCDPLEPGTYRFVYWGIITDLERENDREITHALGSTFTVTKE